MRDINNYLPKLPKNSFGALTNFKPNKIEREEMIRKFPFDSKWHEIFNEKNQITIDGKTILKQKAERYT